MMLLLITIPGFYVKGSLQNDSVKAKIVLNFRFLSLPLPFLIVFESEVYQVETNFAMGQFSLITFGMRGAKAIWLKYSALVSINSFSEDEWL